MKPSGDNCIEFEGGTSVDDVVKLVGSFLKHKRQNPYPGLWLDTTSRQSYKIESMNVTQLQLEHKKLEQSPRYVTISSMPDKRLYAAITVHNGVANYSKTLRDNLLAYAKNH
ncbi:MAG: hypothetical protein ACMXYF_01030 [Candidatus Woesearchaeota archaeon]